MKPSDALQSNRVAIRRVVASHHAWNARVFGSVLHGEDTDGSDLDLLIDTTSETTLMDVAAIQVELQHLLGVAVDVLTAQGIARCFPPAGPVGGCSGVTKAWTLHRDLPVLRSSIRKAQADIRHLRNDERL